MTFTFHGGDYGIAEKQRCREMTQKGNLEMTSLEYGHRTLKEWKMTVAQEELHTQELKTSEPNKELWQSKPRAEGGCLKG